MHCVYCWNTLYDKCPYFEDFEVKLSEILKRFHIKGPLNAKDNNNLIRFFQLDVLPLTKLVIHLVIV